VSWSGNAIPCISTFVRERCSDKCVVPVAMRSCMWHKWQYVVSKIFHITGDNVSFVCNVNEAVPFCELLIHRNVTFLKNLQKFHSQHLVIGYLVRHSGKNELHALSDIL